MFKINIDWSHVAEGSRLGPSCNHAGSCFVRKLTEALLLMRPSTL